MKTMIGSPEPPADLLRARHAWVAQTLRSRLICPSDLLRQLRPAEGR